MSSTTPSATKKSASWASVKVGGRPPEYFGYSDSKPSSLKLCSTARTRSSDVNATLAIWATSMPWADSSTICARRHVTTDPELRRTMRSSRWPSSLLISRTRTLSAIPRSKQTPPPNGWTRQANVAGYGTRTLPCVTGQLESRLFRAQPPAVGERRVVVAVAYVDGLLGGAGRPGVGQVAGERLLAEQHVRDALTLRAGQPGRHQRVDLRQLLGCDHLRTAGHD